jgi:hypothetical protein
VATLRRHGVVEGAGVRKSREASSPLPEASDAGARRGFGGTWDMDPAE